MDFAYFTFILKPNTTLNFCPIHNFYSWNVYVIRSGGTDHFVSSMLHIFISISTVVAGDCCVAAKHASHFLLEFHIIVCYAPV
jgi:hypothetical protein